MANKLLLLDTDGNPGAYLCKDAEDKVDWTPKDVKRMMNKGVFQGYDAGCNMALATIPRESVMLAYILENPPNPNGNAEAPQTTFDMSIYG